MIDHQDGAAYANILDDLSELIYESNVKAGWWTGTAPAGDPRCPDGPHFHKWAIPTKLALVHSEISEALEGYRKNSMDDHLPHRKMIEVELADALIRIFDIAGALNLSIGEALVEKYNYNQTRADHKPEARSAPGGKSV